MTEIGSVGQSFNVLRKDFHQGKSTTARANFEENFGEIFSKVAAKNFTQAVLQKDNVKSSGMHNYAGISFSPKNKKSQEVEAEILDKMLKKVRRLAVEWVNKRREGDKK